MGAGRARTINREIVELDNDDGTYTPVDLDSELIQKLQEDYEAGILNFNMTDEEFQEYLQNSDIKARFGWGLDDAGDINLLSDTPVKNEDLKYFVQTALETVDDIQTAFQESTGSKDKVVDYVIFDTPSGDVNLGGGTKGYQEKSLVTTDEIIEKGPFSYNRQYNASKITLDASESSRLSKEQASYYKSTGQFNATKTGFESILTERSSSRNGWFSASGSYSKTTVAHEMGHAVFVSMQEVFGKSFSKTLFSEWHSRTYSSPVSGYAQRNYSESFAECFSLYVVGGNSSSKMYTEFKDIMSDFGLSNMYGCVK